MTAQPRRGSAEKAIPHTRIEDECMIWDSYETGRKLGQGAFGKVYQAQHKGTGIQWAIKTVNKEKAGSSAIKLLEREVAILKRVSHPGIISLNEVFETSKRMYLVMELCEGGELADVLKERKYFMESEVKIITRELASAIAYLHKNEIVHRDIKLENILVSKYPDAANPEDKLQIKVTDFGLSIALSGPGHDNMMQDFCGTPNYMAPEIIDNKSYSQGCDVWALGVIVYTLFCGKYPFRSTDDDTLYELIKKGDLDFSDDVWNEVSSDAKNCIQKMLNVDPAHRLSASEVVDHHWITGSQDKQTNVLDLMKMWKDDLRNDTSDDDETSAINGELEPREDDPTDGESADKPKGSNSTTKLSESQNGSIKGTGGTKKPGSGGKRTVKTLGVGLTPRTTAGGAKPTASISRTVKSPMPNTGRQQAGPTNQVSQARTNTHNTATRTVPATNTTNRINPTAAKPTATARHTSKGNTVKK